MSSRKRGTDRGESHLHLPLHIPKCTTKHSMHHHHHHMSQCKGTLGTVSCFWGAEFHTPCMAWQLIITESYLMPLFFFLLFIRWPCSQLSGRLLASLLAHSLMPSRQSCTPLYLAPSPCQSASQEPTTAKGFRYCLLLAYLRTAGEKS